MAKPNPTLPGGALATGRRGALLTLPALMAAAGAAGAAGHPDAQLLRDCAAFPELVAALNDPRRPDPGPEADEAAWGRYSEVASRIGAARPVTLEGWLAKARACKAEAYHWPTGQDAPHDGLAAEWAWDLLNDMLAMAGRG